MRKKKMYRMAASVMALLMSIASLTACGNTGEGSSSSDETEVLQESEAQQPEDTAEEENSGDNQSDDELVTLTLYPRNADLASGVLGGWRGEYLASKGIQLEIWAYSDEKTNAILASGDLPDIMYMNDTNYTNLIEGNMLVNLDEYLDDMPNAQAFEKLGPALKYIREYQSAGTGNAYFFPLEVGLWKPYQRYETDRRSVRLNWDVYEAIGAPKINSFDDLIPVMKEMLAEKPTAPDGSQCYGTVLNAGSDTTYWGNIQMWYYWNGYDVASLQYLLETNMIDGTYYSILEEDSEYRKGLEWYNKVYREGLMDPDSISIDRQTQKTKVESATGNAMVPSGTLPGWEPNYLQYYIPGSKIYCPNSGTFGFPGVGINAKTEHLEECLEFLDLLCSPDEYMNLRTSLEGEVWEVTPEGYAVLSEKYLEAQKSGEPFIMSDGSEWNGFWTSFVVQGGENSSYVDEEGNPRSANPGQWKEIFELNYGGERYEKWQKTTGYDNWLDWLEAENAYYKTSELSDVPTFAAQPSESQKLTIEAIRNTVVNASWKMVYAQSDEEFDQIWDQMVKDCEGLGCQELMEWRLEELKTAKEKRDEVING